MSQLADASIQQASSGGHSSRSIAMTLDTPAAVVLELMTMGQQSAAHLGDLLRAASPAASPHQELAAEILRCCGRVIDALRATAAATTSGRKRKAEYQDAAAAGGASWSPPPPPGPPLKRRWVGLPSPSPSPLHA